MPETYDVIIIGTGAGSGTLAQSEKPTRLLEGGDLLLRAMDNWSPNAAFIDGSTSRPPPGMTARGRCSRRRSITSWAAVQLYGAAHYRLRPTISAISRT
jgi:hypothetical protein